MMKLEGKTAVVTGGGGAIGTAVCLKLAELGAGIAVVDINAAGAEKTVMKIREAGGSAESFVCDITDYAEAEKMMNGIIKHFKNVDILVNVAGGSARDKTKRFSDQDMRVVEGVIKINLFGTLNCIRAVVNHMIANNHGKIVNFGSTVGIGGLIGCVDYSASKGAVFSATKTLAMELGRHNINVNCVSPGIVPRPEEARSKGEAAEKCVMEKTWVTRICTPDDITNMVVYLCSPESDYITGQNFVVDGGRSIGLKGE